MIISICTEKAFVTNTTSFHDKNPQQIEYRRYMCACILSLQLRLTLWLYGLKPTRLLCPRDSSIKTTEVGCQALFPGILPTQESNPCHFCLPPWQAGFWPLASPRKPIEEIYPNLKQVVTEIPQPTLYSVIEDGKLILR